MKNISLENSSISGWGLTNIVDCELLRPKNVEELIFIIKNASSKSLIARGLGRSYGDAAQLKGSKVISLKDFNKIDLDRSKGTIRVGSGVSLEKLLNYIVPKGFFIPVSPGTSKVTIGGAIASDVHGKNHHVDGSFGDHVIELVLINGKAELQKLYPNNLKGAQNTKEFWATIGGMGLTGVIIEATFSLIKIESSFMSVDTIRFDNLNSLINEMIISESKFRYSVAWIDSSDKNGRGILSLGNHAQINQLSTKQKSNPLNFVSNSAISSPNFLPKGLINKFTIAAFNKAWFYKSPSLEKNKIQKISSFFHTLDGISKWNNIYGKSGFIQYQFVVPSNNIYMIKKTLDTLREKKAYSFLTVLKQFGNSNNGLLSFPEKGWTLAIDVPNTGHKLLKILDDLDEELAKCGGKIYLAKDARQSSNMFKKTYKSYENWKNIKLKMDPEIKFVSDISNRLKMFV